MRCFGARIAGDARTPALLVLINPTPAAEPFLLPGADEWELLFDTANAAAFGSKHSGSYEVTIRSVAVFQQAETRS